jgi:hypothetical protein
MQQETVLLTPPILLVVLQGPGNDRIPWDYQLMK